MFVRQINKLQFLKENAKKPANILMHVSNKCLTDQKKKKK